ncbi:hypothetical protein [Amycolatopsis alba]|uniref:hypothetical protein n=1 Tax=Amycolatopsis alba TaxID=76020 RepID=UPI0012F9CF56|nr:hypothetical protein [Amycolatopsis alba]
METARVLMGSWRLSLPYTRTSLSITRRASSDGSRIEARPCTAAATPDSHNGTGET